jgi:two-component system alkaline phosphatase synthesis response regulator PhoP
MKVLICEDEEILLTAIEFRLRKQGYEVLLASDGRQALEKIKTEKPDLVVADIMMPHITGLELVDFVRNEFKSDLPIIIISALEHDDVVLHAFRLGANDFVTKPFKPAELVLRVKRLFQEAT